MMTLELTRIFVKVVQNGSFSKAAVLLKLPKSTVSKSVARLEKETGTKLLLRTTRSLTPTQAGRSFYEASLGPILRLEEAQKSLYGRDRILTGTVKITAPEDLGSYVIAPAIAELSTRNPGLEFELVFTNEVVDLVREGFDLAVRLGRISDSGLKMKRVGENVLVPVASPKYLKGKEKIRHPSDLKNHSCLALIFKNSTDRWALRSSSGIVNVAVKSKVATNQMTSLLRMALSGSGIALLPRYICQEHLEAGRLVRVLPEWSNPGLPVSIITPLAPSSSVRLKAVVDQIREALASALS